MSINFGLTKEEEKIFRKLNTPSRLQDFLNTLQINFEKTGETLMSPRDVLEKKKAHCTEGALLAAAVLWYWGQRPLLLDLKTIPADNHHAVALYKRGNLWGAISKTNHAVLRYRDPVYKSPRELAMSYFHEYFLDNGKKTLRVYSDPFDLSKFGISWVTSKDELWHIDRALDRVKHHNIVPASVKLRKADKIEIRAGKIVEWHK